MKLTKAQFRSCLPWAIFQVIVLMTASDLIFMRYVHWGTGRGVYLAILPLFVWGLLQLHRRAGWLMAIVAGLSLILAHKAGIPTLLVLLPVVALTPFK